jgi:hypothetical protein
MKKLLLATILLLSVNSAFALSENDSSDCQSLSSSTADSVVISNDVDVQENPVNASESSSQ